MIFSNKFQSNAIPLPVIFKCQASQCPLSLIRITVIHNIPLKVHIMLSIFSITVIHNIPSKVRMMLSIFIDANW